MVVEVRGARARARIVEYMFHKYYNMHISSRNPYWTFHEAHNRHQRQCVQREYALYLCGTWCARCGGVLWVVVWFPSVVLMVHFSLCSWSAAAVASAIAPPPPHSPPTFPVHNIPITKRPEQANL